MSRWTHAICAECYTKRSSFQPVTVPQKEETTCCFCGKVTKDGIFYRAAPEDTKCGGNCDH